MSRPRSAFLFFLALLFATACGSEDAPTPGAESEDGIAVTEIALETAAVAIDSSTMITPTTVRKGPWGDLVVRARLVGEAPESQKLSVSTDRWLCGQHDIRSEQLIVDGKGGVKNVVAFLAGPPGASWSDSLTAASFGSTRLLDQKGCRFDPHVRLIPAGTSILLRNSDPLLHNARGSAQAADGLVSHKSNRGFNLAMPRKDQEIRRTINKPGVMAVACDVHAWMKAYVVALPNPYGTVTDDLGEGRIEGIPVGTRVIHFWHETLGEKNVVIDIEVGSNEVAVEWTL